MFNNFTNAKSIKLYVEHLSENENTDFVGTIWSDEGSTLAIDVYGGREGFEENVEHEDSEFSFSNEDDDNSEEEPINIMYPLDMGQSHCTEFELGQIFPGASEFKTAVRNYAVKNVKDIKFVKNDPDRVRAACKNPGCPWVVYASLDSRKKYFQVKTFNCEHTCAPTFKCSQVTSTHLANRYEERIRSHPG